MVRAWVKGRGLCPVQTHEQNQTKTKQTVSSSRRTERTKRKEAQVELSLKLTSHPSTALLKTFQHPHPPFSFQDSLSGAATEVFTMGLARGRKEVVEIVGGGGEEAKMGRRERRVGGGRRERRADGREVGDKKKREKR